MLCWFVTVTVGCKHLFRYHHCHHYHQLSVRAEHDRNFLIIIKQKQKTIYQKKRRVHKQDIFICTGFSFYGVKTGKLKNQITT